MDKSWLEHLMKMRIKGVCGLTDSGYGPTNVRCYTGMFTPDYLDEDGNRHGPGFALFNFYGDNRYVLNVGYWEHGTIQSEKPFEQMLFEGNVTPSKLKSVIEPYINPKTELQNEPPEATQKNRPKRRL